jgi:hypothetical protein
LYTLPTRGIASMRYNLRRIVPNSL